jgi:hypothetical protein
MLINIVFSLKVKTDFSNFVNFYTFSVTPSVIVDNLTMSFSILFLALINKTRHVQRNTYKRERLSTADILIKVACFVKKVNNIFII